MKILCVCRAGIVRSVALMTELKNRGYTDTIPMGVDFNSPETQEMLFKWADKILVVEEVFLTSIPEEYKDKTQLFNIGPDTYGNSQNPELRVKIQEIFHEVIL